MPVLCCMQQAFFLYEKAMNKLMKLAGLRPSAGFTVDGRLCAEGEFACFGLRDGSLRPAMDENKKAPEKPALGKAVSRVAFTRKRRIWG